jgi:hypothetical protein
MVKKSKEINCWQEILLNEASLRIRGPYAFEKLWHQLDSKQQALFAYDMNGAYEQCNKDVVTLWLQIQGGTYPESLIEVAYKLGFLTEHAYASVLPRFVSQKNSKVTKPNRPFFDRYGGELLVEQKTILKVRNGTRESGSWLVLGEFQECRWAKSIKNPLEYLNADIPAVIRNLNRRQKTIRFRYLKSTNEISWFHVQLNTY